MKRVSKVVVTTAVGALALSSAGVAGAAAASVVLGAANRTTNTTTIQAARTPLALVAPNATTPPLAVNSSAKVGRLNADLLDGKDVAALQSRVGQVCPVGGAIRGIAANGSVVCDGTGYDFEGADISTTGEFAGIGAVVCPDGGIAVAGGYSLKPSTRGIPAVVYDNTFYDDEQDVWGYAVKVVLPDGSPYDGGGVAEVTCLSPGLSAAGSASTSTLSRSSAPAFLPRSEKTTGRPVSGW